jgi:hypothetical protein
MLKFTQLPEKHVCTAANGAYSFSESGFVTLKRETADD